MAIGLADGLTRIGKSAIIALREPSLGPVLVLKAVPLAEDMLR